MIRISSLLRLMAVILALALFGAACGGDDGGGGGGEGAQEAGGEEAEQPEVPTGPDTAASTLRASLDGLLQEHVVLTTAATNAVLAGRSSEFEAASAAVGENTEALTAVVESVLGADAAQAFDTLWKRHIDLFFAYARGQAQAMADLTTFAQDFGAFVNSHLPSLPADAVAELMNRHVATVKDVIDAQGRGDQPAAFTALRAAGDHMVNVAEPLTAAMAVESPDRISGDPESPAADLLVTLNGDLREHVYLLTAATGAALGNRQDEFAAARAALDQNSADLVATIGSVYGTEAGRAFEPLWKKHITFFIEYTTGVAANDAAQRDKAVQNLFDYSKEFGAFISSASPELTQDTVAELIKTHALTVKDAIDAQGAGDYDRAYPAIRTAAEHMRMIGTPLVTAIVAQFPDRF